MPARPAPEVDAPAGPGRAAASSCSSTSSSGPLDGRSRQPGVVELRQVVVRRPVVGRPGVRRQTLSRVERVGREVARDRALALGDGLHEQVAADERALPRRALAAEDLLAVAPAARLVDADLEALQLLGDPGAEVGVVGGDRADERAVGGVHRGEQLGLGVDQHDRVERPERLGVAQRPARRRLEHAGRRDVGAGVLARRGTALRERPAVQRDAVRRRPPRRSARRSSAALEAWMTGPKLSAGRSSSGPSTASGWPNVRLSHHRQVHLEERREQLALHGVARVGGAALLGVVEALLQVPGEARPSRRSPRRPRR